MMLYPSNLLQDCKIPLNDYEIITASGKDAMTFLQGQLTCNLNELNSKHFLHACHCLPTGKLLGTLFVFMNDDKIFLIVQKTLSELHLTHLKKFSIFSKVIFERASNYIIFGLLCNDSKLDDLKYLTNENNAITQNEITYLLLPYPIKRFITITTKQKEKDFNILHNLNLAPLAQWHILNLEANFPVIDKNSTDQFLPQAFNLTNFDAINFKKGCYCGQEMVARAQYRGANKRALYLLTGKSKCLPALNAPLIQQINQNQRDSGYILVAHKLYNDEIWIQVILSKEIDINSDFKIKEDANSHFKIKAIK